MFRKTFIRLTLLYAVLLILLISIFGTMIYGYEQGRTFHDSNRMLQKSAVEKIRFMENTPKTVWSRSLALLREPDAGPQHGPGALLNWIIYDSKGKKVVSSLDGQYSVKAVNTSFRLLKIQQNNQIVEKSIGGYAFHIFDKKTRVNGKIYRVSVIMDVTTEKKMLHELLLIILTGIALGAVVCVLAGYFLAKRSLRPIEKAWEKQSRFVADASHELRTPLSIIQLKIEGLLRQPKRQIQDTGEDIAVMLEETRRLSKLVGSLLTLARSDANRLEVLLAPLDLKKLIRKVTEPFTEMAAFEEKNFKIELDQQPLMISGDEQRVHQLLVILLDNAMKFTKEGGTVSVSCWRETKYACLTVADSGQGISDKDLPHIFERFYQADISRSSGKGTGLGLSIAQWIVSMHRGKIEAKSEMGKGTSFIVRLPLLKKEAPLQAPESEE